MELQKLLKKETTDLAWNASIPPENQRLLADTLKLPAVQIIRSVKPSDSIWPPAVFAFLDRSADAYGCCIYVKHQIDAVDEKFEARLIASKV